MPYKNHRTTQIIIVMYTQKTHVEKRGEDFKEGLKGATTLPKKVNRKIFQKKGNFQDHTSEEEESKVRG